ncbi:MAG: DUF1244 domain-containing protein [Rhodothalassiaceae bacterium]
MDQQQKTEIEAAVLRKLLAHLQHRTDVQNVDLMGLSGFCRNCLADWWREAAEAQGVPLSKEAAREAVYGMAYDAYKQRYQTEASQAQLDAMAESVRKNAGRGF